MQSGDDGGERDRDSSSSAHPGYFGEEEHVTTSLFPVVILLCYCGAGYRFATTENCARAHGSCTRNVYDFTIHTRRYLPLEIPHENRAGLAIITTGFAARIFILIFLLFGQTSRP